MKFLIFVPILLFTIHEVRALAVAQPIPSNITLKRGGSLPFKFEIQAITSREDQLCTYSISGLNPLKVRFDKKEVLIEAGNVLGVFGALEVPLNAPIKEYEGKLTISCKPNIVAIGVSLIVETTELPFLVKVIKSEEEDSLDWEYFSAWIFVGIVIVFIVWSKSKHKPKSKKKKRILKKWRKADG